jgi:alpha-tubulin suppressor-like RCC1 family protein
MLELGHGGEGTELAPRMIEALAKKKVIGASAGGFHTPAWTGLFTFGNLDNGMLGHRGEAGELVPRLFEALAGKKVVGASAGTYHTAVWTEAGEVFTFGNAHMHTGGSWATEENETMKMTTSLY